MASRSLVVAAITCLGASLANAQGARLPSCIAASSQPGFALTVAEVRAAMTVEQGLFGGELVGDGTAHADTARHLAMAAQPDLEGGNFRRGYRLYCAAFAHGIADSRFYRDAIEVSKLGRHPEDCVVIYRLATQRWPNDPWGWSGLVRELEGRNPPAADSARQQVRRLQGPDRDASPSRYRAWRCR